MKKYSSVLLVFLLLFSSAPLISAQEAINETQNVQREITLKSENQDHTEQIEAVKLKRVRRGNTCSWTFFGAGTAHSLMYSTAAAAIGITGPIGVIIPFAIGAIYGVAGTAGC